MENKLNRNLTEQQVNIEMKGWVRTESERSLKTKIADTEQLIEQYVAKTIDANNTMRTLKENLESLLNNEINFFDKLSKISLNPKVEKVDLKLSTFSIVVTTTPLIATATNGSRYAVGAFEIEFKVRENVVLFKNLTDTRRSYWGSGCQHPHVSQARRPCLGNIANSMIYLASEYEYQGLFDLFIAYLEAINLDDIAGRFALNWDRVLEDGTRVPGYRDYNNTQFYYASDGKLNTLVENVAYCTHCSTVHLKEDMQRNMNDDWVCPSCIEKHYDTCESCGKIYGKFTAQAVEGFTGCYTCQQALQTEQTETIAAHEPVETIIGTSCCQRCGQPITGDMFVNTNGEVCCETCYVDPEHDDLVF